MSRSISSHNGTIIEFHAQSDLAFILYILISTAIITGNTLILLATWRERCLHQPNKYFIACLAVADLLVGIFIGPARGYGQSVGHGSLRNIHLCCFILWIDNLVFSASICSLSFISFDRYLKISKPLHYRSTMTTSKSLKIIFIIWLMPFAFATYAVTPDSGNTGFFSGVEGLCHLHEANKSRRDAVYTFAVMMLFISIIIMLVMYARIFVLAHQRQKMVRNGELGETSTGQNQRSALRHDLKIAQMLLIVVGVLCFCWLPIGVFQLLSMYYPDFTGGNIFQSLLPLLAISNSLCNPIIYACLDRTYREAFIHLSQKLMCRTRSFTQQRPAMIELRPMRNN